jgi:hypothetical protein
MNIEFERDLAHENDMRQLRKEQLRAEFSDEELEDMKLGREAWEELQDDQYYLDDDNF